MSDEKKKGKIIELHGEEAEAFVKNKTGKTPEELINSAGKQPLHPEQAKGIFLQNLQNLINESAKRMKMTPSDIIGCLEIAKLEIYTVNKQLEEEYQAMEEKRVAEEKARESVNKERGEKEDKVEDQDS